MPSRKKDDKAEPSLDDLYAEFFGVLTNQTKDQLELWSRWMKEMGMGPPSPPASELIQIAAKHSIDLWEKWSHLLSEDDQRSGLHERQREFYLQWAKSYSEMLKEMMTTSVFMAETGTALNSFLDAKIASDKFRDTLMRNMGIPTREDIEEVNRSLYNLNKKLDQLSKELRALKGKKRSS